MDQLMRPHWARALVVGELPDNVLRYRLQDALMPYRDYPEVREELAEIGPRRETRPESPRHRRR